MWHKACYIHLVSSQYLTPHVWPTTKGCCDSLAGPATMLHRAAGTLTRLWSLAVVVPSPAASHLCAMSPAGALATVSVLYVTAAAAARVATAAGALVYPAAVVVTLVQVAVM